MANTFALILAIATLVTGIIWCLDKFRLAPVRRAKLAEIQAQAGRVVDEKTLEKVTRQPWGVETATSVFPVLAVVFLVRSFVYEPFQIPSGSMMPTLLIGDFILVEKFAYGIRNPITQTTLIPTGEPRRGDVAVFKYPGNTSLDYIKRVIGLPGDRIIYDADSKKVTVFPACGSDLPCRKMLPMSYSDVEASDFIQTFSGLADNEYGNGFYEAPPGKIMKGGLRLATRNETLDKVTHRILLVAEAQSQPGMYFRQSGQPESSWVVPEGHYFMMGDNRDNSADSRYWGFVPERNLVGKATTIWMSFEKQEGEWPTGVRLQRIGSIH